MRVTRGAEEAGTRAERELASIPRIMLAEVRLGAVEELKTKTYQDRTRNARESTRGRQERTSGAETVVSLDAGAEYASYLRARGFSSIDDVARETGEAIADQFAAMGKRITRG